MKKPKKQKSLQEKSLSKIDERSFKMLFETYSERLFTYINSIANDTFLAQDVVQDTFIKVWDNREHLSINKSVVGYLYKTAYTTFCNKHRKHKRESKMLDSLVYLKMIDLLEEDQEVRAAKIEQIQKIIEELPPKTLEVFRMCKYQGYKYHEIAKELDISVKTVENQMSRAFSIIRKKIKDKNTFLLFLNIFQN